MNLESVGFNKYNRFHDERGEVDIKENIEHYWRSIHIAKIYNQKRENHGREIKLGLNSNLNL